VGTRREPASESHHEASARGSEDAASGEEDIRGDRFGVSCVQIIPGVAVERRVDSCLLRVTGDPESDAHNECQRTHADGAPARRPWRRVNRARDSSAGAGAAAFDGGGGRAGLGLMSPGKGRSSTGGADACSGADAVTAGVAPKVR